VSQALRLIPIAGRAVDLAALARALRLFRRRDHVWIDVAGEEVTSLKRDLALLGIATEAFAPPTERGPGWLPAVGRSLEPLVAEWDAIDVVRAVPLDPGSASARVLGSPWSRLIRTLRDRRRDRCRALLRREDALLRWERRAWVPPEALRDPRVRRTLRPIVFDRAASREARPGGCLFVSDRALERWAFT
jgi:hypothetical protein